MVRESRGVGRDLRRRGQRGRIRVGDRDEPRLRQSREDGQVNQAAETTAANQGGAYGGRHGRRPLQKTDRESSAGDASTTRETVGRLVASIPQGAEWLRL